MIEDCSLDGLLHFTCATSFKVTRGPKTGLHEETRYYFFGSRIPPLLSGVSRTVIRSTFPLGDCPSPWVILLCGIKCQPDASQSLSPVAPRAILRNFQVLFFLLLSWGLSLTRGLPRPPSPFMLLGQLLFFRETLEQVLLYGDRNPSLDRQMLLVIPSPSLA